MNVLKQRILLFLKGVGMGGADVVPGVSGGTIAFITGIYEELLDSIKSVDGKAFQLLLKFQIKAFWGKVNGNFLVTLFSGIFLSLLTLSRLISYLLEFHPIPLWSFFFGLIIISAYQVFKEIKQWHAMIGIFAIAGVIIAYLITSSAPSHTTTASWFFFITGAIAICAMILPGISGSFIMLIMGKYEQVIQAVKELNLVVIALFGAGCVVGLLSFSRLVSWLLKKYHDATVALLAGFMIGSLNKIWPWKKVLEYHIDRHGEKKPLIEENIAPGTYESLTGEPSQLVLAIVFMLVGIFFVVGLEKWANMSKK